MGKARLLIKILLAFIFFIIFSSSLLAAESEQYYLDEFQELAKSDTQNDKVTLNADRVSFNDETGRAIAEGNAVLTYNDVTIMAERMEYDADTQKVEAMPLPGQQLVLTNGQRSLKGDNLTYDLNTREGILRGAQSRLSIGENDGVLYVYGKEIDVMPWELARERGLVQGPAEDYLIQWKEVVLTTCALDHPHYRLESKNIIFIPGKRVVAKRPRIYLGNTYLFTSPLDYVVELKRRSINYSFLPYFQHSDVRGSGVGLTGTVGWDTGSLAVGLAWASKAGWETKFELNQDIGKDFTLTLGTEHSWDDAWHEQVWRPYAALRYSHNGWGAMIRWTKNEYIQDQKDSRTEFKGRLERKPEILINTPHFRTSRYTWTQVYAGYGHFQETIHNQPDYAAISRYGIGLRNYFEYPFGGKNNVEFFSNSEGVAWFYDSNAADHEMYRSFTGFRYKLGSFEMGTAYENQTTWGESPMHWDQYKNRKRIHQRVRFPLGREVYFVWRGSYDLDAYIFDEIFYSLQWVTDCMRWDLHYKNDRTSGGDNRLGITLSINAYPSSEASLGQNIEKDPFDRPSDLPKEKKK